MRDVTRILSQVESGDPAAAGQLLPLVYDELRKLAAQKMAYEKLGQTLEATALVHEADIRLVDVDQAQHWNSRGHFFAAAAEAMRRVRVENARRKQRLQHGGKCERAAVDVADLLTHLPVEQLIALDDALDQLRQQDPVKAQLVTLRYSGGMTIEQASEVLQISRVTACRYWTFARAWLYQQMAGHTPAS